MGIIRLGRGSTLLLATVALVLAACGGTVGPGVASLGSTTTTTNALGTANPSPFAGLNQEYQYTLSYAACMRVHGLPTFPDPVRTGGGGIHFNQAADSQSPQYSRANDTCKHLLPDNGGMPTASQIAAETTKILQQARCIRAHGVPNFPDPKIISNSHQFGVELPARSILNSAQFRAAQKVCGNAFPGF